MKDLDFDELDRAVNSLMSNVPKSAPQTTTTNEKMLDLTSTFGGGNSESIPARVEDLAKKAAEQDTPSTAVQSTTPATGTVAASVTRPAAPAIKAPARPQSSTPAVRRAGRFMDVVHPSSDMNMKKPEVPRPPSRQGLTIEPIGKAAPGEPIVQPQPFAAAPVMPETEKNPMTPAVNVEAAHPVEPVKDDEPAKPADTQVTSSSSDWPDPLEMAAKNDSQVSPTSPFLADAKVEKRPLGGLTPADTLDAKESEPKAETEPESNLPAETTPELSKTEDAKPAGEPVKESSDIPPIKKLGDEDIVAPLPEELRGDLMAVEADTTHDELKQQHDTELKKEQPPTDSEQESPAVKAPKMAEPKTEAAAPSGPTSIPQQYHEEPSTGDQDNGAIYDTSTYHQPLAHPAKKKSGWLWVIWIVVILLLGAAGGAAIYFMKLV